MLPPCRINPPCRRIQTSTAECSTAWATPCPTKSSSKIVCLLLLDILATSTTTSWPVATCDSAHSWRSHSSSLQPTGTMARYCTQSHYPGTYYCACPYAALWMPSARLGTKNPSIWYIIALTLLGMHSWPLIWEACTLLIWLPRLVTKPRCN